MVVDYHALTSLRDPEALRKNTIEVIKDYLAVGVDPEKAVIFKQSEVPAHTELAWIFDCLVSVPFLMQGHAYKDKVAKGLEPNAGLFTYPMLMAADILLYDTDVVPVGEDQRQHVEYAREAASKFNNAFAPLFKEPKERILAAQAVVPGTDGQKMSKSYKNTIPLFGSRDEIAKAVMGIVTDSGLADENQMIEDDLISSGPGVHHFHYVKPFNLYRIHRLFRPESELDTLYTQNASNYKALKEALIEDIDAFIAPMREKRAAITDEEVARVLAAGAERARAVSEAKMAQVRKAVGVA